MGTGAITYDVANDHIGTPAAPMSEDDAIAALVSGHEGGFYVLPKELVTVYSGTATMAAAVRAGERDLMRFPVGWEAEYIGRAAARLRTSVLQGAAIPANLGAELAKARAEYAPLVDRQKILEQAARSAEAAPMAGARQNAPEIAEILTAALGEILAAAGPHAAALAPLDTDTPDLEGFRADPVGWTALEAHAARFEAIEAAGRALERFGTPWADIPPGDGSTVLRMARLAAPNEA